MENGFDRLIGNLHLAKERTRESESSSTEVIQPEEERENRMKKNRAMHPRAVGQCQCNVHKIGVKFYGERRQWEE